jgi:transposase
VLPGIGLVRVKLMYLPPYSRDLNLIEEVVAELKVFVKRKWRLCEEIPSKVLVASLNGMLIAREG